MRNLIDFSSWQGVLTTLLGLVIFTLVAVGIRLLVMQRVQQRRERQNRQINERLKLLIAAYKTLGGSFTGTLSVDPRHRREWARQGADGSPVAAEPPNAERRRRIRDAVEAALSDVILLGTADQVRLAARAAEDMVAGREVETAELVRSLRDFIRAALDLEPVAADVPVPRQGPVRAAAAGRAGGAAGAQGGSSRGGARGAGGGGLAAGGMLGAGAGAGAAHGASGGESEVRN